MENAESITIFIPSMQVVTILLLIYFLALATCTQAISDTISMNQTIRDGETIVSPQQSFELGFFSPTNTSQNRYLGIWYKQFATGTVVWVANRETPIRNNSGELTLHPGGLLILRDSTANRIVWSSNSSTTSRNTVARLLDNSNLMVVDSEENSDDYIWQSFDHPGDTIMPEMKFGRNLRKGAVTNYSSWKSRDDPSQGPFMIYMVFNGLPQIFQKKGDQILYRLGSWNGVAFSGTRNNHPNPIYRNWFYTDENEVSGVFELRNKSVLTRLTLSPEGTMNQWNWFNRTQGWFRYSSLTSDSCERYALCGVHGVCDIGQSPNCGCLRGFTPKRPDQWVIGDWSSGCRRETPLNCGVGEGFRKYSFVKRPDTRGSWFDRNMTLEQCETKCGNECNCTAYTTLDIKQDTGCVLWYNELVDMRVIPDNGQDIYIRMSAAELDKNQRSSRTLLYVLAIIMPVSLGLTIVLVLCVVIIKKMKNKKKKEGELNGELGMGDSIVEDDDLDLPAFNLTTLSVATNYFSSNNKLGEGGFGPVYKGFMEDGQEIAVKRLSIASKQGVEEFKNEVIFISKLQHRNLVNLLGYCVEGTEKLLVYEFMPNNSLDLLLFDETRSKMLDWSRRFHIINGIARGLLYLHQDSQLLIIHRDLKAANILLDQDMNPRISDFGLARSFGGNETERNTTRVAGTYGYMSPEYAGDGKFSVKLDVFSFGVLVLEIVSGKRNRGFFHLAHSHNLLGHAWKQFKEGRTLDLADPSFRTSCDESQVLRSIHVGLLCVQHDSEVRPSMAMVVMMLSDNGKLPEPRQPGFYSDATLKYSGNMLTEESYNLVTESILMPR